PGIIGSTGWDRSSAWIWDFSSTDSTSARAGGARYSPTTSRTFSTNCGSLDSLNPSARCGLSRNAFQIRPTVDLLSPDRLAIDARDQCVASAGVSSNVATITASTCSSVIVRGTPGRGSSTSPSSRGAPNRQRHLPPLRPRLGAPPPRRAGHKPRAPLAHRRQRHAKIRGDLLVRRTCCACQHDPAAQRQRLGALGTPRPARQRLALLISQNQRRLRPPCPRHPPTLQHSATNLRRRTLAASWC